MAKSYTISDVGIIDNLKVDVGMEVLLAGNVTVDFSTTDAQVLYVSPSDEYCRYVTKVVLRNPSGAATSVAGVLGTNSTAFDNWSSFTALTTMIGAGNYYATVVPAISKKGTGLGQGGVLNLKLSGVNAGVTAKADVFGYLAPASRVYSYVQKSTSANSITYAPHGLAIDGDGYLYVADWGNNRIVKLDAMATYSDMRVVAYTTLADTHVFTQPDSIAIAGAYLYVTDKGADKIQIRNKSDLTWVANYGSTGSGVDQFNDPTGICTDGTYLYIGDSLNYRVVKVLISGLVWTSTIGSAVTGTCQTPDQFGTITSVTTDGVYIWVVDSFSGYNRITKRRRDTLAWVSTFWLSGGTGDYEGIVTYATYYDNCIYATDANNKRVVVRSSTDLLTIAQANPNVGYLFPHPARNFVAKFGSTGTGDTQFVTPYGVVAKGSHVFVSDNGTDGYKIADWSYVYG
jgi:hypothetical protein